MEKISEMIKRMCPEGVKKVKLKDVGYTYTGLSGKNKDDFKDGNALYVTYSNIFNNPSLNLQIEDKVQINDGEKQNEVLHGDILFTGSSETPEEAGMSSVVLEQPKGRLYLNSFCFGFRLNNMSETYPHYMRYILRDNKVRKFISKTAFGVTRFNINKERMLEVEIPLPPLPIQQEIVRVLDSFTQLQSNLEAELVVRQKQYEFYRNKLFTFDKDDESVEWKILGDVGEVRMCKRILKSQTNSEVGIPFYKIGTFGGVADAFISKELYDDYKSKYNYPKKGDILISAAGTIGRTVEFDGQPSYFQDSNIVWIENDEKYVTNKYLKFFYSIADWKIQNGGSVSRLYNDNLKSTIIPIPSLQRQQEIVSTLDTFESLITNLKKEIEARKKQYEYYREQLLTFE